MSVGLPSQVDDPGEAGHADGDVGQAGAPRPPERVGHNHRHLDPRVGAHAVADALCRTVRIDRQQRRHAVLDVGEVDAGVGAHEAVAGLADDEVAAAPYDACRFRFHERSTGDGIGSVERDEAVLGLRDDLLGHDETVTVLHRRALRVRSRDHELGDAVSRTDLGHPLDGDEVELVHEFLSRAQATASSV
jgi:hypothetical protein